EVEPVRLKDQMLPDPSRRFEVFLDERRRHGERFGGVVKTGFVGRVDGELAGRTDVDAGQVADRVIVFSVAQSPGDDWSRIAGVPRRLVPADGPDPLENLLTLFRFWMSLRLLRRHVSGLKLLADVVPAA